MKKREGAVDRIVGPKKDRRAVREALDSRNERGFEGIEAFEVEKTELERQVIDLVQEEIVKFMERHDRTVEPLNPDRIHILKEDGVLSFTRGDVRGGVARDGVGSIAMDREASLSGLAVKLFHELMHTQSYDAMWGRVDEGGEVELAPYRSGITVHSSDGESAYFSAIEEALAEISAHQFFEDVVKTHPLFADESPSERTMAREGEIAQFRGLVEALVSADEDLSEEEVMEVFWQAKINGKLLPLARLMRRVTGGDEAFRRIAEMSDVRRGYEDSPEK